MQYLKQNLKRKNNLKYLFIILSLIFLTSCCKPAGITTREEIKYIYKDSINYVLKADTFKVNDTITFLNFFPYVASTSKVKERIVYRSDGTFRKKFDSLYLEYSLLDSTFKVISNSSPDTVFKEIIKEVYKEGNSFLDDLYRYVLGIVIGFVAAFIIFSILRK